MTGSAVKRSGTKWTVSFTLPFKQGGWVGRGVVKKFEPTGRWADFQRGSKKGLFFCINFCIDCGVDLGSYFGQKIYTNFNVFLHSFSGYDFHVIM